LHLIEQSCVFSLPVVSHFDCPTGAHKCPS
jgi:hypothetical protein